MKANYNVTGNDRKALVAAIENLTGDKAVYMRMPTCAYEIGDVTGDKEGSVTCEDADKLERIIHSLIADGFAPEDTEEVESTEEATGLTVSLPLDKVAVGNLTNLLTAKESLIKKALGNEFHLLFARKILVFMLQEMLCFLQSLESSSPRKI